jgi:hypothetical protein
MTRLRSLALASHPPPGIPDALLFGLASFRATRHSFSTPAPMLPPLGEQVASLPLRAAAAQIPTTFTPAAQRAGLFAKLSNFPSRRGPIPHRKRTCSDLKTFCGPHYPPPSCTCVASYVVSLRKTTRTVQSLCWCRFAPFLYLCIRYRRELRKPAPAKDFFGSL